MPTTLNFVEPKVKKIATEIMSVLISHNLDCRTASLCIDECQRIINQTAYDSELKEYQQH